ncbi:MAG: hypothetical protein HZB13_17120 [Acidobacteria bacterium]|nr:hypothetical protein [Acidobacteriota bacterium]
MNRNALIGIGVLVFLAFVGVMTMMMMGNRKNRVEVCVENAGRTACSTASGETREAAVRTATDGACSLVASGMSETMACGQRPPKSVRELQ